MSNMTSVKNSIINCQKCGKIIVVRAKDYEKGSILCSHAGCNFTNLLLKYYYNQNLVNAIPSYGRIIHTQKVHLIFDLQIGLNVVGQSSTCQVQLPRILHSDKCYISRRHCTIDVKFDRWAGKLRYLIQDGASSLEHAGEHQSSLNGTTVNGYLLKRDEKIDLLNNEVINLGGMDIFKIETYEIPPSLLESYRITDYFNPEETQ
jgi:pSer/pThr/pTyr-binding forkhead associated (FHA) protein